MTTATKPKKPDLLSLLQLVESTPTRDLDWARHCTRQQAVLLRLHLPDGRPPQSVAAITKATGIPVWVESDLPTSSKAVLGDGHAVIFVDAALPPDERLRACLRALKRIIDLPARLRTGDDAFSDRTYRALDDHFADLVLEEHGP